MRRRPQKGRRHAGSRARGMSLQMKMLIGFLIGLVAGLIANPTTPTQRGSSRSPNIHRADRADLPAPAVHAGDPAAVLGAGDRHRRDGRSRTSADRREDAGLTTSLSSIAVLIGLDWSTSSCRAGRRPAQAQALLPRPAKARRAGAPRPPKPPAMAFLEIIPGNRSRRRRDSDMLAVMVFALVFGIGLAGRHPGRAELEEAIQGLYDVMMQPDRHRHPAGADRRRLLHVQSDGAVRLGPAGPASAPTSASCCSRSRCTCSASTRR